MLSTASTSQAAAVVEVAEYPHLDDNGDWWIEEINTTTGEIEIVKASDLPVSKRINSIARAVKSHQIAIMAIKNQEAIDLERIKSRASFLKGRKQIDIDGLMVIVEQDLRDLAAGGLAPTDKKKRPYLEIPDCGKISYRAVQPSLDTTAWDEMPLDQQVSLASSTLCQGLIVKITTLKPDKNAIKKAIKKGEEVDGFLLITNDDKLSLKVG